MGEGLDYAGQMTVDRLLVALAPAKTGRIIVAGPRQTQILPLPAVGTKTPVPAF